MKFIPLQIILIAHFCFAGVSQANVYLPSLISDHAVLQKGPNVPIWGIADPGEEVSVIFDDIKCQTQADANGKWRVTLNLQEKGSQTYKLIIEGKNRLVISDIVVGEVWVASGQSNMELPLQRTINAKEEAVRSTNPLLREFKVFRNATREMPEDCRGTWELANPNTAPRFSAVGYYFGRTLQKELNRPVGIISTNWSATHIENWISQNALDRVPDLKAARERFWREADEYPAKKAKFVQSFAQWIEKTNRADNIPPNETLFTGNGAQDQHWIPVKLQDSVTAEAEFPTAGVIWLRKRIALPSTVAKRNLRLQLGALEGFETVYWNGHRIGQTAYRDFPGTGYRRNYLIPEDLIKDGQNEIVLRLHLPVGPMKFPQEPKLGDLSLRGEWQAYVEFAFPSTERTAGPPPIAPIVPSEPQYMPTYLFNGMVHPITSYAIRGIIWYQGEANVGRAHQYQTTFPLLIKDWRAAWNRGDIPFYFCQLANYLDKKSEPTDSAWAELREAQSMALTSPNTGQVVLIDTGEAADIHPRNKAAAGERLARIALARDYQKALPFSGPVYESFKVENQKIRLSFSHANGGLVASAIPATYGVKSANNETASIIRNSPSSELEGFAICAADRKWVWAEAKIEGDTVVVWSNSVHQPIAVRYAWSDNPTCNLYNKAGLPASPFRTDNFPGITYNRKY